MVPLKKLLALYGLLGFCMVANAQSGKPTQAAITRSELDSAMVVKHLIENFPASELQVVSCTVSLYGKGIAYGEFSFRGDSLSQELRKKLQDLKAGNKIHVDLKVKNVMNNQRVSYPHHEITVAD